MKHSFPFLSITSPIDTYVVADFHGTVYVKDERYSGRGIYRFDYHHYFTFSSLYCVRRRTCFLGAVNVVTCAETYLPTAFPFHYWRFPSTARTHRTYRIKLHIHSLLERTSSIISRFISVHVINMREVFVSNRSMRMLGHGPREPCKLSNTVIGLLNLLMLLASVPIIGAGLRMAKSSITCENFLQMPLLVIGFVVLVISLAGFIGACFHVAWALWFYLLAMLCLIGALMGITIFGLIVTGSGGVVEVPGRSYREYRLHNYSPWLRDRVKDPGYWSTIRNCILRSSTCAKVTLWTPLDYLERDMSPVQSGCCKPPTACTYSTMGMTPVQDPDCYRWNNAPTVLCYGCDSCKAGALESLRMDWRKISALNIVVLLLLIGIYLIGCCAFRNTRRAETGYPHGENRMTKIGPRWDYYWWRRWHDFEEWLC